MNNSTSDAASREAPQSPARVHFDPNAPEFLRDPFPTYAALRERAPVYYWEQTRSWLVSRQDDITAVMRDSRFSFNPTDWVHGQLPPADGPLGEIYKILTASLTASPPGDHARLRKLVASAFSPRSIDRMRDRLRRIVEEILDDAVQGDTLDIRRDFAEFVPVRGISSVLGIPFEHDLAFRRFAVAVTNVLNPWNSPEELVRHAEGVREGRLLLHGIIAARKEQLGDDLLSELIRAEEAGDRLSRDELVQIIISMLVGGADTAIHPLCFAVRDLLVHPEARSEVQRDRSLLRGAIEESLRFSPFGKFGSIPRYTLEDVEVGGVRIGKGQLVQPMVSATLRDPSVHRDPDVFNIRRDFSTTLVFGVGPHRCLGAALARLEFDVALSTLLDRFPDMELLERELRFRPSFLFREMDSMLVALNRPARSAA